MKKIRVFIVDDHIMLREGIKKLINSDSGFDIVGESGDGSEAVELVNKLKPDIVLMDISLPSLNGIEATRRIKRDNPKIKVLALTMHDNEEYLSQMLQAGASGYILKKAAVSELRNAIDAINRGESYLYPSSARHLIGSFLKRVESGGKSSIDGLTSREQEVLILIAEGKTNKEIAKHLQLSVKTIESHRSNIFEKLGINDRIEAVRYAIRRGLIEP